MYSLCLWVQSQRWIIHRHALEKVSSGNFERLRPGVGEGQLTDDEQRWVRSRKNPIKVRIQKNDFNYGDMIILRFAQPIKWTLFGSLNKKSQKHDMLWGKSAFYSSAASLLALAGCQPTTKMTTCSFLSHRLPPPDTFVKDFLESTFYLNKSRYYLFISI